MNGYDKMTTPTIPWRNNYYSHDGAEIACRINRANPLRMLALAALALSSLVKFNSPKIKLLCGRPKAII